MKERVAARLPSVTQHGGGRPDRIYSCSLWSNADHAVTCVPVRGVKDYNDAYYYVCRRLARSLTIPRRKLVFGNRAYRASIGFTGRRARGLHSPGKRENENAISALLLHCRFVGTRLFAEPPTGRGRGGYVTQRYNDRDLGKGR